VNSPSGRPGRLVRSIGDLRGRDGGKVRDGQIRIRGVEDMLLAICRRLKGCSQRIARGNYRRLGTHGCAALHRASDPQQRSRHRPSSHSIPSRPRRGRGFGLRSLRPSVASGIRRLCSSGSRPVPSSSPSSNRTWIMICRTKAIESFNVNYCQLLPGPQGPRALPEGGRGPEVPLPPYPCLDPGE
jgi:hypothetical protein